MRKGKKLLSLFMAMILVLVTVVSSPAKSEAASNSGSWSVYYASNGGTGERTTVPIYTSGGGYKASCTRIDGTCTSRTVTIKAYSDAGLTSSIKLNKTVQFTTVASTTFDTVDFPSTRIIYFRVTLTHANGNSATATGTVGIR